VKLISFNDRTEPFQLVARYAASDKLPSGTDPIIGRYTVSGMPKPADGKKAAKIKVRVKLNLHGVLQVTSAQLLEEVEEAEASPAPSASPAPATAASPMEDVAGAAPAADAAAGAAKPDAMETDATPDATAAPAAAAASPAAGAAAAAPAKKAVKIQRQDLKVESFSTGGVTSEQLNQMFEREVAMATQVSTAHNTCFSLVLPLQPFSLFFLVCLMQLFTSNPYAAA